MRGDLGPPGAEYVRVVVRHCLLGVRCISYCTSDIPFRMFAYSSNILKASFDLMDSIPACGTLK